MRSATGGDQLSSGGGRAFERPLPHALAVLVFYSLAFTVFFLPVILSGQLLAPGDGFNFHVPFYRIGQPLWQPLLWGGYPLAADPQAMAWYPVSAIFSLVPRSYNLFLIAAYVLAASFAYGYLYSITRSRVAGLVCGLVYGMSGFMLAQLGHASLVHTAAWVPLIFWALEELRRSPSARWFVVGALATACGGLAGHLQIFLYALGLAGAYSLLALWSPAGRRLRRLAVLWGMLGWGVCLTAVQLIPTAELAGYGQRAQMSFTEFVSFSLPPHHLFRMLFPYAFGGSPGSLYGVSYFGEWGPPIGGWGPTELIVYVGLLPLVLAAIGLTAYHDSRPVVWFWAAAALLAALLAMGDATPLARLFFHLPGYDKFRVPARHLFALALAASALAGFGVAAIERGMAQGRLIRRVVLLGAVVVVAVLLALLFATEQLQAIAGQKGIDGLSFLPWRNPATALPLLIFCLAGASLIYWSRRPAARAGQALLILTLLLDVGSFGWFYEWRFVSPEAKLFEPPANTARYVRELQAAGQRVLPARGVLTPREGFPPNVSALWGVPSASGYSGLILSRISRLLDMTNDGAVADSWQDAANSALDLLAVRYVFLPRENLARAAEGTNAQGPRWASTDLGLSLGVGCSVPHPVSAQFALPSPVRADAIGLISALACSAEVGDAAPVLRVLVTDANGDTQTQTLRAGRETAEWAYDCSDVRSHIKHQRAPIHESYTVARGDGQCAGHSYRGTLPFSQPAEITNIKLEWLGTPGSLDVKKISLFDETTGRSFPVEQSARLPDPARWRFVEDVGSVRVYENLRAQPRAWLVSEVLSLSPDAILQAIKSSRLPDGRAFDPARIALVEIAGPLAGATLDQRGSVSITHSSEIGVTARVSSAAPSFLVLSDVYYPGWGATIDEQPAQLFQTDFVLRGVFVPAGEHLVQFTYAPRSVYWGGLISASALVTLGIMACLWWALSEKR